MSGSKWFSMSGYLPRLIGLGVMRVFLLQWVVVITNVCSLRKNWLIMALYLYFKWGDNPCRHNLRLFFT